MLHFGYCIKRSLRSKQGLFWALIFPVFLGLVFNFMFGNLGEVEQFSEVAVGVVVEEENETFVTLLKEVEMEENLNMFEVFEYEGITEAENALEEENIYAYIIVDGDAFSVVIKEMDIYSSLVKTFLDQYKQNYKLIEEVATKHPEQIAKLTENLFAGENIGIEEIPLKGQDKSPYTQYFYSLLAMACLISSTFGLYAGTDLQADLSTVGARRNVSPTLKIKQVVTDFLADFVLYCGLMAIVLFILVYVYGQDFGNNLGLILLGTWAGCFVGIAAGFMIAVLSKGALSKKEGLCTTFFMVSSFLGGLMMAEMTYIIEENCPVINRINPATLIVNSFKSLAVFGDYQQYTVNVVTLLAIGVIFLGISVLKLRRTKYASL